MGPLDGLSITHFPPRDVTITSAMVNRYLRITGNQTADRYAADSSGVARLAPATLLHYEMYRPRSRAETAQFRHSRERVAHSGGWVTSAAVRVGDVVTTQLEITDRYVRRGRDHVVYELTVMTSAGEVAARGTRIRSHLAEPGVTPEWVPVRETTPTERVAPMGPEYDVSATVITQQMSKLLCGPGKNFHTDREAAVARGFRDVVIAGPHQLCTAAEAMVAVFGPQWAGSGSISLRFIGNVIAGDIFTVRARPTAPADNGHRRYEVAGVLTDGTVACVGWATGP